MTDEIKQFEDVKCESHQYSIRELIEKEDDGELIINPDFQRMYCWDRATASKLIDTILINARMSSVVFNETPEGYLEVIDGKQRLTALMSFVRGKYPGTKDPFKLSLHPGHAFNHKTFKELPAPYQSRLKKYQIVADVYLKDNDPNLKYDLFMRLNSGGKRLNSMELRNNTPFREFPAFLDELANNKLFRKMSGFSSPHARMEDIDWVLGFIAYYKFGYKSFMRANQSHFLNDCFTELLHITEDEKAEIKSAFELGLKNCNFVLGEYAFNVIHKGKAGRKDHHKPSSGLFNTMCPAMAHISHEVVMGYKKELADMFVSLIQYNAQFDFNVRKNGKSNIIYRNQILDKALTTTLSEKHIGVRAYRVEA